MNKQLLQEKLMKIQEILKEIPGVHIHDIRNFMNGSVSIIEQPLAKARGFLFHRN